MKIRFLLGIRHAQAWDGMRGGHLSSHHDQQDPESCWGMLQRKMQPPDLLFVVST